MVSQIFFGGTHHSPPLLIALIGSFLYAPILLMAEQFVWYQLTSWACASQNTTLPTWKVKLSWGIYLTSPAGWMFVYQEWSVGLLDSKPTHHFKLQLFWTSSSHVVTSYTFRSEHFGVEESLNKSSYWATVSGEPSLVHCDRKVEFRHHFGRTFPNDAALMI